MASFVSRSSSSEIPIDILEAVLPKLGINVPISRILKAVNEEQAKRRVMLTVAGAIKREVYIKTLGSFVTDTFPKHLRIWCRT